MTLEGWCIQPGSRQNHARRVMTAACLWPFHDLSFNRFAQPGFQTWLKAMLDKVMKAEVRKKSRIGQSQSSYIKVKERVCICLGL